MAGNLPPSQRTITQTPQRKKKMEFHSKPCAVTSRMKPNQGGLLHEKQWHRCGCGRIHRVKGPLKSCICSSRDESISPQKQIKHPPSQVHDSCKSSIKEMSGQMRMTEDASDQDKSRSLTTAFVKPPTMENGIMPPTPKQPTMTNSPNEKSQETVVNVRLLASSHQTE